MKRSILILIWLLAFPVGGYAQSDGGAGSSHGIPPPRPCVPSYKCECLIMHDWQTDSPIIRIETHPQELLPILTEMTTDSSGNVFVTLHTIHDEAQGRDLARRRKLAASAARASEGEYGLYITRAGAPQDTVQYIVSYSAAEMDIRIKPVVTADFINVKTAERLPDSILYLLLTDTSGIAGWIGELNEVARVVDVSPGYYVNLPFYVMSTLRLKKLERRKYLTGNRTAAGVAVFIEPESCDSISLIRLHSLIDGRGVIGVTGFPDNPEIGKPGEIGR